MYFLSWKGSRIMAAPTKTTLLRMTTIHVRIQSSLRGGKGGFGTLLRSSARQSGARLTTDFGACRDLQGRRLRHVNDEIKLRKWREAQAKAKETGDKTGAGITDAMFDTPSGLYNWHLMVRRTLCSFLVCDSSLLLHFWILCLRVVGIFVLFSHGWLNLFLYFVDTFLGGYFQKIVI